MIFSTFDTTSTENRRHLRKMILHLPDEVKTCYLKKTVEPNRIPADCCDSGLPWRPGTPGGGGGVTPGGGVVCPAECKAPLVSAGAGHNGGVPLVGGTCLLWASKKLGTVRHCGIGNEATNPKANEYRSGGINCAPKCGGPPSSAPAGCPILCKNPHVSPGGASNGGVKLHGGVCLKWSSKPYGSTRYCGDGSADNPKKAEYTTGGGINCEPLCKGGTGGAAPLYACRDPRFPHPGLNPNWKTAPQPCFKKSNQGQLGADDSQWCFQVVSALTRSHPNAKKCSPGRKNFLLDKNERKMAHDCLWEDEDIPPYLNSSVARSSSRPCGAARRGVS